MRSLKTLILSNCSKFNKFQIILENLEHLYLDGTAIKELPESIRDLQKLVKLNMENCKKLERVPTSLGKLQALQEVIFSGCSKLQSYPDGMKRLQNLFLDGTSIKQVPQVLPSASGSNGFSFLSQLRLSGNDVIQTLQNHIGQLYHLQFLDIKHCKNLTSVPTLPPNLQSFDAHGCDSLTTVANPLAFPSLTHHIRSTFIFSECNNLDELAKSCILSYIHKKSQGSDTAASFPGCDVPEWFSHKAYGSKLEIQVAKHHNEDRIKGVALCAVVSFQDYRDQTSGFSVKCTSGFKNAPVILHCNIEDTARKIEADHVFVCYNSLLQMRNEDKKESSSITVCLKFEVIDDADRVVKECKVFKCGLRLVYEAEVKSDGCPMGNHESMSPKTQEADVICIAYNNDEGQEEEEHSIYIG